MAGAYMFAASTSSGQADGTPDTCKIPAGQFTVTVPFKNTGKCASATGASTKVLIVNMGAITISASISSSSGDESGTKGGVKSSTFCGSVAFKQGSSKVLVEGKALVVLTKTTSHNGSSANAVGTVTVQSQAKVKAAL
jgi:hypothetical protein